jgi:hypothetical protein
MLFQHVSIASLAHIDAPHSLTSAEINARLKPTLDRLGIKTDVLGDIAGIHARRLWDEGTEASDAATLAAEKALADAGMDREKIGLLVNTSVSRDFLEPSTASIVAATSTCRSTARTSTSPMPAWPSSTAWTSPPHDRARRHRVRADRRRRNRRLIYEKTIERLSAPTSPPSSSATNWPR